MVSQGAHEGQGKRKHDTVACVSQAATLGRVHVLEQDGSWGHDCFWPLLTSLRCSTGATHLRSLAEGTLSGQAVTELRAQMLCLPDLMRV